jgi:peptidoglycan/xylan/chitin deacetylase (PgdA/CDA1 family)
MAVLLSRQLPNRPNYGTWSENGSVEESTVTDLRTLGAFAALLALIAAGPVRAAECQGKSDALGTSRTLVVDPTEHTRLGMMQYPETLPLADHEVVLTFDDGPRPPYTSRILDILASECAKATFFIVGQMAKAYPDVVRKIHAAGHTIGTHSYSHPFTFNRMSPQQADAEVEGGITAIADAIGDRNAVAPFFRIPGLLRSETVERYLAGRSLMTWSADFPADDWLHISANEITKRALNRIEARGRGMLLLHDIKPATALACPSSSAN